MFPKAFTGLQKQGSCIGPKALNGNPPPDLAHTMKLLHDGLVKMYSSALWYCLQARPALPSIGWPQCCAGNVRPMHSLPCKEKYEIDDLCFV